ncbi:MAG: hypothetical protein UIT70_03915, partial [Clostridia bacterium]|nr:hypothetical protein [Clostridia bacterium]
IKLLGEVIMVKILSVIQNIEQNSQLCQYLTQDNNIDFKITSDEVSVFVFDKLKVDQNFN